MLYYPQIPQIIHPECPDEKLSTEAELGRKSKVSKSQRYELSPCLMVAICPRCVGGRRQPDDWL